MNRKEEEDGEEEVQEGVEEARDQEIAHEKEGDPAADPKKGDAGQEVEAENEAGGGCQLTGTTGVPPVCTILTIPIQSTVVFLLAIFHLRPQQRLKHVNFLTSTAKSLVSC